MNWIPLSTEDQLKSLIDQSKQKPQVIFKHSTRCSISSVAKARLEKSTRPEHLDFYYLDLLSYRTISDAIARQFQVVHESPQILVIKNGHCIYHESHMGIDMQEMLSALN
ncbi:MAG TPA: bacillithiol system redox-active protein YtxJ [Lacibacter sp.]|nr:bacillithiol system redox-active protein YtxJ [Lacibacter sp.]